jgi:hypothetical protein
VQKFLSAVTAFHAVVVFAVAGRTASTPGLDVMVGTVFLAIIVFTFVVTKSGSDRVRVKKVVRERQELLIESLHGFGREIITLTGDAHFSAEISVALVIGDVLVGTTDGGGDKISAPGREVSA